MALRLRRFAISAEPIILLEQGFAAVAARGLANKDWRTIWLLTSKIASIAVLLQNAMPGFALLAGPTAPLATSVLPVFGKSKRDRRRYVRAVAGRFTSPALFVEGGRLYRKDARLAARG